jgi:dienelactone hydrolase
MPLSKRQFLKQIFWMAGSTAMVPAKSLIADDTDLNVHRDIVAAMKRANLSMQFQGTSKSEFEEWQQTFRKKLNQLLGDSTPPADWSVTELGREEFEDHTRLDLLLAADGIPSLPVYLLKPKAPVSTPLPGVLCIHGHGPLGHDAVVGRRDLPEAAMHIEKSNYDYGLQFVRRGYLVAAPCMIPFGRRVDSERYGGKDPCAVTFVRMQGLGRLPITSNLRDLRWTISLLEQQSALKPTGIGCAGLSYGGRMAMLVSAIDQRIRVSAISGALNLMQERLSLRHSCGSQIIPGLLQYGDYAEIGGLIAPRPVVWETGSADRLIVPIWDERFRERLRRVYKAAGELHNLHFDKFQGEHRWHGRVAAPLFDQILKS